MAKPLLTCSMRDDDREPKLSVFCAGYEKGQWRADALVRDFFRRHLASFGLRYSEWIDIDADSAAQALSRAAKMVYTTEKYHRRGELGELFLHGILRDFYDAEPAVSKLFFLDAPNDTMKGFDSVHVIVNKAGNLDLWLGEAKLHQKVRTAIREIIKSLEEHFSAEYLRSEFIAISNKIDEKWPHSQQLKDLLDENTSLDEIINQIVVPVLLTYDSATIKSHSSLSTAYTDSLIKEATEAWQHLQKKLPTEFPMTIYLITLPLEDVAEIRQKTDSLLKIYQCL